ncbi:TetR family transcriptional regulator [Planomonospora sp. ID67723]|uniref:TetR family transcriptional regulator n=1 Tax=Planomonospora sp. ID67723 TaxID=2738134 RepID=UPI0018C44092|nr:TetR family transcriptional regulator [Planomonospora sp. ID67723]MBG0827898.1 TetR family transcriptional regulator [Planomonospora sp. ID67723]
MSLAERKRQLVRDELTEAALKLLAFQGFDKTTIDQITAAAGVSRRTFFRYFQSKEDVVIEFIGDLGHRLHTELAARPADEAPATAVRNVLTAFTEGFREHTEKSLCLTRLTLRTDALLGRYLERQVRWRADMTAELARRMGVDPGSDMRPALIVATAFGAFDTALTAWVAGEAADDLKTIVNHAFDLLDGGALAVRGRSAPGGAAAGA